MKELTDHKADAEIVAQKFPEQKTEAVFHGSRTLCPGHKVWELDHSTGIIWPAVFVEEAVDFTSARKGLNDVHKKVVMKPGHSYCCALNLKNANKRFVQHINKHHGRK